MNALPRDDGRPSVHERPRVVRSLGSRSASDEEKAAFIRDLSATLHSLLRNRPTADRRRHLLSTMLFPTDDTTSLPAQP